MRVWIVIFIVISGAVRAKADMESEMEGMAGSVWIGELAGSSSHSTELLRFHDNGVLWWASSRHRIAVPLSWGVYTDIDRGVSVSAGLFGDWELSLTNVGQLTGGNARHGTVTFTRYSLLDQYERESAAHDIARIYQAVIPVGLPLDPQFWERLYYTSLLSGIVNGIFIECRGEKYGINRFLLEKAHLVSVDLNAKWEIVIFSGVEEEDRKKTEILIRDRLTDVIGDASMEVVHLRVTNRSTAHRVSFMPLTALRKGYLRNDKVELDLVWAKVLDLAQEVEGIEMDRNSFIAEAGSRRITSKESVADMFMPGFVGFEKLSLSIEVVTDSHQSPPRQGLLISANATARIRRRSSRNWIYLNDGASHLEFDRARSSQQKPLGRHEQLVKLLVHELSHENLGAHQN